MSIGPRELADVLLPPFEMALRAGARSVMNSYTDLDLHDPIAEVARALQQLIAAPRIDLAPAEARTLAIRLHADLTSYTGRSGARQVDPGEVELRVGASSSDIRGTLRFTLTGPRREVGFARATGAETRLLPAD